MTHFVEAVDMYKEYLDSAFATRNMKSETGQPHINLYRAYAFINYKKLEVFSDVNPFFIVENQEILDILGKSLIDPKEFSNLNDSKFINTFVQNYHKVHSLYKNLYKLPTHAKPE
jgi:hypothetical protein